MPARVKKILFQCSQFPIFRGRGIPKYLMTGPTGTMALARGTLRLSGNENSVSLRGILSNKREFVLFSLLSVVALNNYSNP